MFLVLPTLAQIVRVLYAYDIQSCPQSHVGIAEFNLEDGFLSETGNSCDGFPSGMNMENHRTELNLDELFSS